MNESSINLDNIVIQYGITSVREILDAGYTVSDFEQIIEEPTLATCNLNKNGRIIAILSFYNLKQKMTLDQLADIPIDLVLPHHTRKNTSDDALSPKQARKNRIIWTLAIHLIAAAIFLCVYAFPALYSYVQNTTIHIGTGAGPVSIVLLVLPAVLITFMWGDDVVGTGGNAVKKILLSLWLILNVMISLAYLVCIDNIFTHRFF